VSDHKMIPIWFFVGLLLTFLGAVITATGVYFIFRPQHETALSELNPSLWWGGVMLAGGLAFLIPSLKNLRRKK
jgi:hypothetical protein